MSTDTRRPPDAVAVPPPPPAWPMVRALVGVGLICAVLIVLVYQYTRPIIAANQLEARQAAVFQVLPGAVSSTTYRYVDGEGFTPVADDAIGDDLVFAGFDRQGRLVGVAVEAVGMGYQDAVRVLYGYAPDRQAIVGMQVLDSRETPGLGDRANTDPDFLANFAALDVTLTEDGQRIAHPIEAVKHGEKTEPWQIDCITGATITSTAIADMIRESTAAWVPRIAGSLDAFQPREVTP